MRRRRAIRAAASWVGRPSDPILTAFRRDSERPMINRIAIPVGAGIASALLFIVTTQGTVVAMGLAYLCPLPLMIAALGWGFEAGLIALGVSCAVVAGAIEPVSGVLFLGTVALPAWILAAVANAKALPSLPLVRDFFDSVAAPRIGVGGLVILAATLGASISVAAMITMMIVYGGYREGVEGFGAMLQPTIREALGASGNSADDASVETVVRSIIRYSPGAIASSTSLMLLVNLYAAARSAQMSQRLNRAWPNVPSTLTTPPWLSAVALIPALVWLLAPEPASQFGLIFLGAFAVIFVLQGLATLHALSRRAPGRPALMIALYLACLVAPRWVLPAVALLGLVEGVVKLRARAAAHPSRI